MQDGGFDTLGKIIKQKVFHFKNVDAMKKCLTLISGDVVQTLGYYEENDGGEGLYEIVNDNSLEDDGGSVHELNNGLRAKLIIKNDTVNVKQFGARGDGETNDTLAIQTALDFIKEGNTIVIPTGSFLIKDIISCDKALNLTGLLNGNLYGDFSRILIKETGGVVLSGSGTRVSNISFKGNENLSDCFGLKLLSGRCKIENVTCSNFRSLSTGIGFQLGSEDEPVNCNAFYISNLICNCNHIGAKIGNEKLKVEEDLLNVNCNAGVVDYINCQSNDIGLYLTNSSTNNFLSMHLENNSEIGLKMKNIHNCTFIRPYMENTLDLFMDENCANNEILNCRYSGINKTIECDKYDNLIRENLKSKGVANVNSIEKSQKYVLANEEALGYFDIEHMEHTMKISHNGTSADAIFDFTQEGKINTIKTNSLQLGDYKLTNSCTRIGSLDFGTIKANSRVTKAISNSDIIKNDENWRYWNATKITFNAQISHDIITNIQLTQQTTYITLFNISKNDIVVNSMEYTLLYLKHYAY